MNAYKCDIETVSDPYGYECVALIHRCGRTFGRSFQLDMRTAAHVRAFCLGDLDISVVSPAPISMALRLADRLATEFRVPCSSMDCIRLIEHCTMWMPAYCAGHRSSSSSTKIAPVLVSNRTTMMTMDRHQPFVGYIRPVNLTTDILV